MAIETFTNQIFMNFPSAGTINTLSTQNNAANEYAAVVGYLHLEAGSGTKTLSAAGGGSIYVCFSTVTWATPSSEYRLGLEDLTAGTGIPDGTQDVYGAKIAGTNAISANSIANFPMTSGTKTVSHGDFIAVTGRMPVRAGTDSLNIVTTTRSTVAFNTTVSMRNSPYGIANGIKVDDALWAIIVFDDGTYGWITDTPIYAFATTFGTIASWTTASVPDEYAATFEVSVPVQINAIGFLVDDNSSAGDDYNMKLYSDPYGTPSTIQTVAVDSSAVQFQDTTTHMSWTPITSTTLTPGTVYAISLVPTAGNITSYYGDFGSGNSFVKKLIPFITEVKLAARSDNTGAFSEVQPHYIPFFGFAINGFDDGSGGSSGGGSYTFIG